ncbi:MAG: type II toxin-antitoxin system VapC family toxin [Bacteroidota bacterium]
MNLLWDTHTVIWYITNDPQLPMSIRNRIESPSYTNFVSLASYWELSIKYSIGRLEFKYPLEKVFEIIGESGFEILEITPVHFLKTAQLDFHHRDPFDRLLIGQSLTEGLPILSKDGMFKKYKELEVIWE